MSNPLEYMATAAGLVEQFQRVYVTVFSTADSQDTVDRAMYAFCQRVYTSATFAALSQVTELPADSEYSMIRFLDYALSHGVPYQTELSAEAAEEAEILKTRCINNLLRVLNMIEIKTPYLSVATGRNFVWLDRGERLAAKDQLPEKDKPHGPVRELTGRASRKEENEPKFPLDNPDATLHIYEWKADQKESVPLERFYWKIKWSAHTKGGYAESREAAADECYKAFYRIGTEIKFNEAMIPKANKQVVLLGSWITNKEYEAFGRKDMLIHIPELASDRRDEIIMYVLGYPGPKTKALLVIKEAALIEKRKRNSTNPMDYNIRFTGGTTLFNCMDWYIYKPEQLVRGEVACPKCGMAADVNSIQMRCVRGQGPLCGPCLDRGIEFGEVKEDEVDMETVTF